jgi:DNA-binding CsgD family transcriptional regulator
LAEAADWAAEVGQPPVEALLRHDLFRLGDRAQGARLTALSSTLESPWGAAAAAAAQARTGPDWEAVAAAFEGCGALVEAMEAEAKAAALHRADGEPRRATACVRRLETLATHCPGVRTPALVAPADAPTPLTDREREIAELAARQLSAADIAERLFLSRRTVENHLQRIYTKLGIGSRAELAEVLDRGPG